MEALALSTPALEHLASAYIAALQRTVGDAGASLTQLMIREFGEELVASTPLPRDPVEAARVALTKLGLADEVEVVEEAPGRWRLLVRSRLARSHEKLLARGIRGSNLLPEALVAAAAVRRATGARVSVRAEILEPGLVEVTVEEIGKP